MSIPLSLVAHLYTDGEFPDGDSTELDSLSIDFVDPLTDLGTGTVVLKADDPLVTTNAIQPEDFIVISVVDSLGVTTPAVVMIFDEDELLAISSDEEHGEVATITGPLLLGTWKDGLVQPPGGTGRFPMVEDLVYDYSHLNYDESLSVEPWVFATDIMTVLDAQTDPPVTGGGGLWALPWADDMPGAVSIVGPTGATGSTDDPVGIWYARDTFITSFDGVLLLYAAADNAWEAKIDGKAIASGGGTGNVSTSGFASTSITPVSVSPGTHVITFAVTNYPPMGGPNPTGVSAALFIPGFPPTLVWQTSGGMQVCEYPAQVPGMTPGNVMRLFLEEQQALGRFTDWSLSCTDELDSASEEWDVIPTIAVRVGQDDGLSLLLKIMETYADVRVDVNTLTLHLYNKDTYSPTSGVTLEEGNLLELRYKRHRLLADELLIQSQLGWTRANSGGRREGWLQLGPENNLDEVTRLAVLQLSVTTVVPEERAPTYKPLDDTEIPYVNPDFVPGATITVPTRTGGTATDRIVQIGISWAESTGEELVVSISTKNLVLQWQERVLRAIKALGA